MFKFEGLKVYQLALEYIDRIYDVTAKLPHNEDYNLSSQMRRSATSIALNIAEGSTGQTDPEQSRFLSMAIRSLLETVACRHIIERRNYLKGHWSQLKDLADLSETLARSLQAMRKSVLRDQTMDDRPIELMTESPSNVRGLCSIVCNQSSIASCLSSIVHRPSSLNPCAS